MLYPASQPARCQPWCQRPRLTDSAGWRSSRRSAEKTTPAGDDQRAESVWEADALPTELLPHLHLQVTTCRWQEYGRSRRHFKPKPSAYIESCFIPVRLVSTVVGGAI